MRFLLKWFSKKKLLIKDKAYRAYLLIWYMYWVIRYDRIYTDQAVLSLLNMIKRCRDDTILSEIGLFEEHITYHDDLSSSVEFAMMLRKDALLSYNKLTNYKVSRITCVLHKTKIFTYTNTYKAHTRDPHYIVTRLLDFIPIFIETKSKLIDKAKKHEADDYTLKRIETLSEYSTHDLYQFMHYYFIRRANAWDLLNF